MSRDTYAAIPKLTEPPRLVQIEVIIRRHLEELISQDAATDSAQCLLNKLQDANLIGLPSDNAARTSVRCDYVAELGAKLGCRKGDDADDVLRTACRYEALAVPTCRPKDMIL